MGIWVGGVVGASLFAVVWSFEPSVPPAPIEDRTRGLGVRPLYFGFGCLML